MLDWKESNFHSFAYQATALPLSYKPIIKVDPDGIEPSQKHCKCSSPALVHADPIKKPLDFRQEASCYILNNSSPYERKMISSTILIIAIFIILFISVVKVKYYFYIYKMKAINILSSLCLSYLKDDRGLYCFS